MENISKQRDTVGEIECLSADPDQIETGRHTLSALCRELECQPGDLICFEREE